MSKDNETGPADGMIIRLGFNDAFCITTEEYEELHRNLFANGLVDEVTLADKIILSLLEGGLYRYNDIKRMRAEKAPIKADDRHVCERCGSDNITTLEAMPVQYLCECGCSWR
jgi:hypothetical protein